MKPETDHPEITGLTRGLLWLIAKVFVWAIPEPPLERWKH